MEWDMNRRYARHSRVSSNAGAAYTCACGLARHLLSPLRRAPSSLFVPPFGCRVPPQLSQLPSEGLVVPTYWCGALLYLSSPERPPLGVFGRLRARGCCEAGGGGSARRGGGSAWRGGGGARRAARRGARADAFRKLPKPSISKRAGYPPKIFDHSHWIARQPSREKSRDYFIAFDGLLTQKNDGVLG